MSEFVILEDVEADGVRAGAARGRRDTLQRRIAGWIQRRRDAVAGLRRLATLYFAQDRLIFPGSCTQGQSRAEVQPMNGSEIVRLRTACGESVAALFGPALTSDAQVQPDAASCPTLLFFYGNKQCLADVPVARLFDGLRRLGVNVLVPEYIGYGLSSGDPSEAGCYATADAAYQYLLAHPNVDQAKIVAAGASLGGAVAIDLASRTPAVAGLVSLITFTSMPDMARVLQPNIPIWRFIRHHFESERKMPRVTCPTLIVHSTGDELVPYSMADRLAEACAGPVSRVKIEGAGHSSVEMLEGGGGEIYDAMTEFFARV